MGTADHLTVDQIIDGAYAAIVPPDDPDDHDMLVRLADEVLRLRRSMAKTMDANIEIALICQAHFLAKTDEDYGWALDLIKDWKRKAGVST